MSYLKEQFRFEFESDSSASYIVIRNVNEEKLQKLQIEMIEQNPDISLIPLSLRARNNEYMIFYNITSKITLIQLLRKKSLRKEEFLDIVISIFKTVMECKNYYAYDKNFALDEELIYINPGTMETSLLYIPISFDVNINNVIKDFIKRLIDDLVRIDSIDDLGFMHKIRLYLRDEAFNIKDLVQLLNSFKYTNKLSNSTEHMAEECYTDKLEKRMNNNCDESSEKSPNNLKRDKLKVLKQTQNNPASKEHNNNNVIQIPRVQPITEKSDIDFSSKNERNKGANVNANNIFIPGGNHIEDSNARALKYPKSSIIFGVIIQAAALLILVTALIIVLKGKDPDMSIVFGVGIVLGAVDFLIMRKLFDKKNMVATSQSNSYGNNNVDNKGAFQNKSIKSIQTPSNINTASDYNKANKNFKGFNDTSKNNSSKDSSTSDRNSLDKSFQRADQSGIMGTELLNDNSKADTVLLQDSSNLPYLLNLNSG
ncbi:MAG: DUF6382 domain-containing protein, partial [Bacillota bacterium]|nr:DUF6382 domain-containing protein [Bacillota bacterium]